MSQGRKPARRNGRTVTPSPFDRPSVILNGDESDAFSYLGMHRDADGALVVRVFYRNALSVVVLIVKTAIQLSSS